MSFLLKRNVSYIPSLTRGLRRPFGLLLLAAGITGCILPILPGLPLLVVGARLLGRRDPALRRLVLAGRAGLRRLRAGRHPLVRRAGLWLTPHWQRLTRLLLG